MYDSTSLQCPSCAEPNPMGYNTSLSSAAAAGHGSGNTKSITPISAADDISMPMATGTDTVTGNNTGITASAKSKL